MNRRATHDANDHKCAAPLVVPEDLREPLGDYAVGHGMTEGEALVKLLDSGLAAFQERTRLGEVFNFAGGATLVVTAAVGGREAAWLHRRTDSGWVIAYRLFAQAGRPVVGELRVFPDDATVDAGGDGWTWSGEADHVPAGGLRGRLVRAEVRVGDDLAMIGNKLRWFRERFGAVTDALGGSDLAVALAPAVPSGGGRRDNRGLARVAAAYAAALDRGSRRPNVDAAAELGIEVERVREKMFTARERTIFSGGSEGKAGGQLTPFGQSLLDEQEGG